MSLPYPFQASRGFNIMKLMRPPFAAMSTVYPSPGAFATKSGPMLALPPGLLSTMTGWEICSDSRWPIARARTSTPPPAAKVSNAQGYLPHAFASGKTSVLGESGNALNPYFS